MGRVHPEALSPAASASASASSSKYITRDRESFTIWMKSLVFHSYGCAVFNSKGEIVFRVDNYQRKCSSKVYLMNLSGEILFSIQKQKLRLFGRWNGYKWSTGFGSKGNNKERPWFQVRRNYKISKGELTCHVNVQGSCYNIIPLDGKSAFKIVDSVGQLVAEVKEKQSARGVSLGDDILTLVVEPHIDQSLIVALVMVHGLINRKM